MVDTTVRIDYSLNPNSFKAAKRSIASIPCTPFWFTKGVRYFNMLSNSFHFDARQLHGGHYFSFVKADGNKWFCMDDDSVVNFDKFSFILSGYHHKCKTSFTATSLHAVLLQKCAVISFTRICIHFILPCAQCFSKMLNKFLFLF